MPRRDEHGDGTGAADAVCAVITERDRYGERLGLGDLGLDVPDLAVPGADDPDDHRARGAVDARMSAGRGSRIPPDRVLVGTWLG